MSEEQTGTDKNVVEAVNIGLQYGDQYIFKDLSFVIQEGEKVCVTGPSGTGKSSLLNAIMGFVPLAVGQMNVFNTAEPAKQAKLIRKKCSWLPQNVNLPFDTGVELLSSLGHKPENENVKNLLGELGMDGQVVNKPLSELSGGQKQRIIFAACMALERPVLVLDEPTAALDESTISRMIQIIKGRSNLTVISCSHNITWINSCDKLIKLG